MLVSFICTTWVLAMLPGVGQALMLRQTLTRGPRIAVLTILGTITGLVLWSTAAGVGLSAVVLANPIAYRVLVIAGGAFLAFVGLRTLANGRSSKLPLNDDSSADLLGSRERRSAFLAGLATNLGNPKAGVFAVALLPGFLGPTGDSFWHLFGLGLVWALVTGTWYLVLITLVARGRGLVARPRAQQMINVTSGIVLVAIGTGVAAGL